MLQPPSPGSFVWFWLIYSRREASTAAVVTLDTVVDERRMMTDNMTRSPARLCSRDGKLCYYGRLEYEFLALLPCFLLFIFSPSLSRRVSLFRVASPVPQSSAALLQRIRVIIILSHLGIPFVIFM